MTAALFLRSDGPDDPVQSLWRLDLSTGDETLLCDPRTLGGDLTDLPPEERARRERARESGGGIVAYSADADLSQVCFALSGRLFPARRRRGQTREVPVDGPVVDPRIDAVRALVAFVRDRRLWVVEGGVGAPARRRR